MLHSQNWARWGGTDRSNPAACTQACLLVQDSVTAVLQTHLSHTRGAEENGNMSCKLPAVIPAACWHKCQKPSVTQEECGVNFSKKMWLKGNWQPWLCIFLSRASSNLRERSVWKLTRPGLQGLAQDIMKIRLESLISNYNWQGKGGGSLPFLPPTAALPPWIDATQTSGHVTKWHSSTWTASFPCKSALHLLLLRKLVPQELIQHPLKFMDCLQGTAADLGRRFKGSFNQLCFQGQKTNGAYSMKYL